MENQGKSIFQSQFDSDVQQIVDILKGRSLNTSELLLKVVIERLRGLPIGN